MKEKLNENVLEYRNIQNKAQAIREKIKNIVINDLKSLLALEVEKDTYDDVYEVRLVFFSPESRITVYFDCDFHDYAIEIFNQEDDYSAIITHYFDSVINS